jgi:hypothetical protein
MFTLHEIAAYSNAPKSLQKFLRSKQLIATDGSSCHQCDGHVYIYTSNPHPDQQIIKCDTCQKRTSIFVDSIFHHSRLKPFVIIQILASFWIRMTPLQTANLTGVFERKIKAWFKYLRELLQKYLNDHPFRYPLEEIVECDEMFLRSLRRFDDEGSTIDQGVIFGMVGRTSGVVELAIIPDNKAATM